MVGWNCLISNAISWLEKFLMLVMRVDCCFYCSAVMISLTIERELYC